MYPFDYHRPATPEAARDLFAELEDARFLAGGQSLIPMMKLRFAQAGNVIDLRDLDALRGVTVADGTVTIGAMTRHAVVATDAALLAAMPALAELAGGIGDPMVRRQGTIGGSVANNDPSADYPAACLGLGATILTTEREIAADDFFLGVFETALDEGELIVAVRFPVTPKSAYAKFRHPASRFALTGAFVSAGAEGVRVAITGAGSQGAFRWAEAEAALADGFDPAAIEGMTADLDEMNSDMHADAPYRAHLAGVMAQRAVAAAAAR